MKLKVENFAKIKEADIEVNGVTVIAGENNTGKSTIGKVLYCIYQSFHSLPEQVLNERRISIASALRRNEDVLEQFDYFEDAVSFRNFINQILNSGVDNYKSVLNERDIEIKDGTNKKLRDIFSYDTEKIEKQIITEIFSGEFNDQLIPLGSTNKSSKLVLQIKNKETNEFECIDLHLEKNRMSINSKIDLYKTAIYIDNPFVIDEIRYFNPDDNMYNYMNIAELLGLKKRRLNHNDVLREMLSKTFNHNISLIEKSKLETRLDRFIEFLKDTLQGDIIEHDNKFMFYDNTVNETIEIGNLSTGIKSFAILLKLIKTYDITDKSLIVLDEPEIHLHPKWQLKFAEILVMLQKEFNLNIVITSHSPYFIRAIEIYLAKYDRANVSKYYLSELDDENRVCFEDVTTNTERIYKKLAEPLQILTDEEFSLMSND